MAKKVHDQELLRAFLHSLLHSLLLVLMLLATRALGARVLVTLILFDCAIEFAKISPKARRFIYYSRYSPFSYVTREEEKSEHDIHAAMSGLCGMLAVELFFPMFLTPAMLTLAFADPLARILGKRFGKKRILKTQKTFIGSGVFWCVAAIILFSTGAPVLTSLFVGIAAAILEIFSWSKKRYILVFQDNFLIPTGVAVGLFLSTYFTSIPF